METVDLKLVLLGQPGVGKTCLVYRFLHNTFGETISTIGASFAMKKVDVSGRPCNMGIWDTAGQERFDSLSSFYCRGARPRCNHLLRLDGPLVVRLPPEQVDQKGE